MDARPGAGALAAAGAAALVLAASAAADRAKIRLTPAGNAAARAVVVQRADLGSTGSWTGGPKKPDLSSSFPCSYQPKQSDLVVVGAARTVWDATGIEIDSESEVLQTARMVTLDWQRSVLAPQVLPCLRTALAGKLGASGRLVSFTRVGFPGLARYARRYRGLVDVASGTATVRVMIDIVLVGTGRTEITLMTTAPAAADSTVAPAELRLARLLVSRVQA